MSKHPLQFIEIPRKDPEKEIPEVRIKHFDEIYEYYENFEAAFWDCGTPLPFAAASSDY